MEREYDLILMDIDMPEIDGIELTQKLRESPGPNRNTIIQGLTAYGQEEYLNRAKAVGMNGFSTKPIRLRDLDRILQSEQFDGSDFRDERQAVGIDFEIVEELREALGEPLLGDNLFRFFAESELVLAEIKQLALPDNRETYISHLHKLSGAAALFGLKALAEKASLARAEIEGEGDRDRFTALLAEIEAALETARGHFSEFAGRDAPARKETLH